jgi:F5/8 type C domain/Bacterial alpha-L-rhamnosidase 6 hairpin glycosidase domain
VQFSKTQIKNAILLGAAFLLSGILYGSREEVLDSFEGITSWIPAPAEGVKLELHQSSGQSGNALKLDFDYQGHSGWAAARKNFNINLPDNYEFSFWIRGDAPVTHFEFKLIDPSGQNVWWVNKRNFEYPREWQKVVIKKRQISFAWGPAGKGEIQNVAAIEFAITSAAGGKGSVFLDELMLRELPPVVPYNNIPQASASSELPGNSISNALDNNPRTAWRSSNESTQLYEIDFRQVREFGGMVIDWDEKDFARNYEIQISEDKTNWTTLRSVQDSNGGRDYLFLPETESRYVQIRLLNSNSANGYGIREIEIKPLEFASSPNAFFTAIAKDAPPGFYPRAFAGELSYWTVLGGVDGDFDEGLLNEDGALEPTVTSYSIEPFLWVDGHLVTWNDVKTEQSLEEDWAPLPSVRWIHKVFTLDIKAAAVGQSKDSSVIVNYRITNKALKSQKSKLFLAIRPFQVNPPSQFLNTPGGVVPIRNLKWAETNLNVNQKFMVMPLSSPTAFGACSFDQGDISEFLRAGKLPVSDEVTDSFGYASGAFEFAISLNSGESHEVSFLLPMQDINTLSQRLNDLSFQRPRETFQSTSVEISLPDEARPLVNTVKSNIAYILINRDGPAIQPGSRAYARSWIRDGSLTSTALLRLGFSDVVQQFIEWYAKFQYPNGKVPCCVDARGADPVAEHDSHGEFIYIIAEYYRYTKDKEFLLKLWPNVTKAVSYIDSLRKERRTPEYQAPGKRMFFGLLPESISHEGYSAKPVHSYWDDFFALKGLKDAVEIATVLGKEEEQKQFTVIRDEFKTDLYASLRETIAHHKIDYIPGSADLGDFDATSTTTAIAPGGELENLPQKELLRTFERYYEESVKRAAGSNWEAYTPYELRTVGTMVRLGWRVRAHEMLQFFMQHRRPAEWNQWAEVVFRDPRALKFIGDMPHTWVGSDFIRSFLDFFVYEREKDQSLILGAGISEEWAQSVNGVSIQNIQTIYGPLTYSLRAANTGAAGATYKVAAGTNIPPGGIILTWPLAGKASRAMINGRSVELVENQVVLRELPAEVLLQK